MMNCGYDPDPSGFYDTPPIAPQMWQAYQITGEMAAIGIMGALYRRPTPGTASLSTSVHGCVGSRPNSTCRTGFTCGAHQYRRTCRHSRPNPDPAAYRGDQGRAVGPPLPDLSGASGISGSSAPCGSSTATGWRPTWVTSKYQDPAYRARLDVGSISADVVNRFISRWTFDREIWRDFQADGLTWAPMRRPEENLADEHWRSRETFIEVYHPELGRSYTEVGANGYATRFPGATGRDRPSLGEHNAELLGPRPSTAGPRPAGRAGRRVRRRLVQASAGRPFALDGVRFIDLGWLLASAGAGRFLAAMGAEVIKVEHKSRWDGMRWVNAIAPDGGRAAREAASGPHADPGSGQPEPGRLLHGDQRRQARRQPESQASAGQGDPPGPGGRADIVVRASRPGPWIAWASATRSSRDQSVDHLCPAVGLGPARHLRPAAQLRAGGAGVLRPERDVRAARAVPARRDRLLLPRLVRRVQHGHRHDGGALPAEARPARVAGSTPRRWKRAST